MAEPRPSGEIYGSNFDEVFRDLLFYLSRYPDFVCSPRGQKIKECLAQTLVLEDPTARLIHNPAREANYGFAAGEFLWYFQGFDDLEMMLYYNKRMGAFSDDGKTLNSAYGARMCNQSIYGGDEKLTQWEACIRTLCQDTDSRRALLLINAPQDNVRAATVGTKDVPCTLSLQFFIRENRLHLHVHMRSNDAIWGLTNDLFSFTLFQEVMLLELKKRDPKFENLELGTYYHTAGSLHLYERHFELAEKIIGAYEKREWIQAPMPPIPSLEQLWRLCEEERRLRKREIEQIDCKGFTDGCLWLASHLNMHRQKRDAEEARVEKKEAI